MGAGRRRDNEGVCSWWARLVVGTDGRVGGRGDIGVCSAARCRCF